MVGYPLSMNGSLAPFAARDHSFYQLLEAVCICLQEAWRFIVSTPKNGAELMLGEMSEVKSQCRSVR